MVEASRVNWDQTPPEVTVPRVYNAAHDIAERPLRAGLSDKVAVIDDAGRYSYAELGQRINRAGNMLKALGVQREQRVFMCLLDSIDFPAAFWGAIKIGAVPTPVNTQLTGDDYAFMLADSRAGVAILSAALLPTFTPLIADQTALCQIVVAGGEAERHQSFDELCAAASPDLDPAPCSPDEPAFWLYSSGSTGTPKGVVHAHSDLVQTAVLYGVGVLGIKESDVVFSAAKLFFAYGLGNGMTFPYYVGATAVLMAERPTPQSVMQRLSDHQPTIFYGVPTLFGAILADDGLDKSKGSADLRVCVSAGEALPEEIAHRWVHRFGVDILDGIGSTEMLHIFLSNQPGDIRYGTTGKPVPGYSARLLDEAGGEVAAGEVGELVINGPSSPLMYWNNRWKSRETFQGPWTYTGDKFTCDADGYYVYAGRSDDMLKVGGIWVSPFEVESTVMRHPAVLEAAVVGHEDGDGLIKPKAVIVARDGYTTDPDLAAEIQEFVKQQLALFKYPRWVEFTDALPKTATGKVQRYKLRAAGQLRGII